MIWPLLWHFPTLPIAVVKLSKHSVLRLWGLKSVYLILACLTSWILKNSPKQPKKLQKAHMGRQGTKLGKLIWLNPQLLNFTYKSCPLPAWEERNNDFIYIPQLQHIISNLSNPSNIYIWLWMSSFYNEKDCNHMTNDTLNHCIRVSIEAPPLI